MRSMRGLNGDDQTLIIRSSSTTVARIIPDRQILQVFVSYICVFAMGRVRKDLLLLLFKLADQVVQILLNLTQLLLIGQYCKISVSQFRVHVFHRICIWCVRIASQYTLIRSLRKANGFCLLRNEFLSTFFISFTTLDGARSIPANIILTDFAN